ncbi:MAG: hypothetical protein IPP72_21815 [Chitinophagaceae bacterium]|nr:hypothetical protein [Chitinophagaceae bacterium]
MLFSQPSARVVFFKMGISLKTEKPAPVQIKNADEKVLTDAAYKNKINKLAAEFATYNPNGLTSGYAVALPSNKMISRSISAQPQKAIEEN